MNIKLRKYVRTMLFQYIQYVCNVKNVPLNNRKYFHQKYADKGEKHNFPFIKIINFIKLRTCHTRQCKIQMFSIDCITTKSLIFFIIRCWSSELIVSSFVFFCAVYRKILPLFLNIMWYEMKWVSSIVCNPCTHPHNKKKF